MPVRLTAPEKYLSPDARRDAEIAAADITYRINIKHDRLPAIGAWLDTHAG